ncbi:PTS sugar transporter subunit IIA [Breznakiellaceae bacterium SP9]
MKDESNDEPIRFLVSLGLRFTDKDEAIRQACRALTEIDCLDGEYAQSMLSREALSSTYLDRGLAIPHGTRDAMVQVKHDGIAVLQVPDGVSWGPQQIAQLIVAIAARSDAHLEILRHLLSVLRDEALLDKLKATTDAGEIELALTGKRGDTQ